MLGRVELQDASSQAAVLALPELTKAPRILDYCAGGGGKALALAARYRTGILAHDADLRRMSDIPARAARAGADIRTTETIQGVFDLVFCDVPCSGSGAWRRQPDAKWSLTADRLDQLIAVQAAILDAAEHHVAPDGMLAYATCSILRSENEDQIASFLERSPGWHCVKQEKWLPGEHGDGFGLAILTRSVA